MPDEPVPVSLESAYDQGTLRAWEILGRDPKAQPEAVGHVMRQEHLRSISEYLDGDDDA